MGRRRERERERDRQRERERDKETKRYRQRGGREGETERLKEVGVSLHVTHRKHSGLPRSAVEKRPRARIHYMIGGRASAGGAAVDGDRTRVPPKAVATESEREREGRGGRERARNLAMC